MKFYNIGHGENATLTANGGVNGGEGGSIQFYDNSGGGMASVAVFGNGSLVNGHKWSQVTIGSLEGDGLVFLGANGLIIGSNNRSTQFSGLIQDDGSLTKIRNGTFTLSGANTYTGVTTIEAGTLRVDNQIGSATGTGTVNVNAGTLGGGGIITGATTVGTGDGTGSLLAPSVGNNRPTTLTIQNALTFKADGAYTFNLDTKKAKADQVAANGVTIQSGAQFTFSAVANKRLQTSQAFTAINNTSATAISGTFANLAEGSTFSAGRNKYQVSYAGGDGNDLTLTVVP